MTATKGDLQELRHILKRDIKELELRLTIRLGGIACTALLLAILPMIINR